MTLAEVSSLLAREASRPGEFQLLRTSAHFRFDCAPSGVAGEARLHASHHWRALIVKFFIIRRSQ